VRFPGGFEGAFESENLKKSPCGRGAIWGVKTGNSLGAPKWAIHVKILLNGLFKLIKGTFHLLELGLFDLKGDCGYIFCASSMAGILVFLSVDYRSRDLTNQLKRNVSS
jgi:hypothetical protein